MAAAQLAENHFVRVYMLCYDIDKIIVLLCRWTCPYLFLFSSLQNARDSSVISDLAHDIYQNCNVSIHTWYRDSSYHRATSVDHFMDVSNATGGLCAVLGPVDPRAAEGVSVLTENKGIPQLQYATIARSLNRRSDFPSVARTIGEVRYYARSVAEYLQREGKERDYLTIIYDATDYGEQFEDPLENARDEMGFKALTEHIVQDDIVMIRDAMLDLANNGYHTVILATDRPPFMNIVADIADELGLIGDQWLWMLSSEAMPPQILERTFQDQDSPLNKLFRGAGIFADYDPFILRPKGDTFLKSWKSQDGDLITQINALHPLAPDNPAYFAGDVNYFQTTDPSPYSSFLYDSVMLAGMSACQLQHKEMNRQALPVDTGGHHLGEIFETKFQGASGAVKFDLNNEDTPNSRDPSGVGYGIYNIRAVQLGNGTNRYTRVLTSIYDSMESTWSDVEGEEFIFYDGTTNQPTPLLTTFDFNYISDSFQILGLSLMSLAIFLSLLSGAWVFVYRNERIVRASQPEFLYILCAGSAIMATSLVFISFDEEKGWSQEKLSKTCQAFPWFFVMGYLTIYCAVFSKLWRINKLLSVRRQNVKIQHALWPFAIMFTLSLVVLIVWQVVNPLIWIRNVKQVSPRQTYGECSTEDSAAPYIAVLGFLMGTITIMTMYISWKTKDVHSALSESSWIFYGIFSHIQIWVIGIPTYIILNGESADAAYLISVALVFILSTVMVGLVIWPKIHSWAMAKFYSNTSDKPTGGGATMINDDNVTVVSTNGTVASTYGTVASTNGTVRTVASANSAEVERLTAELESVKKELDRRTPTMTAICEEAPDPEEEHHEA
jgi:hypothetical protein